MEFIKSSSSIVERISENVAIKGGGIQGSDKRMKKNEGGKRKPVSYIDAILMALAEDMETKVITGDPHFKGFHLAEYIP